MRHRRLLSSRRRSSRSRLRFEKRKNRNVFLTRVSFKCVSADDAFVRLRKREREGNVTIIVDRGIALELDRILRLRNRLEARENKIR